MDWLKRYWWVTILIPGLGLIAFLLSPWGKNLIQGARELIAKNIFPNNNPGNLRPGENYTWHGQTGVSAEDFVIFDTPENGLRAMGITALNYQQKDSISTLSAFGDRWAPPASIGGDNPNEIPGQYGQELASTLNTDPNAPFDLKNADPFTLADLMKAIVKNENGVIKANVIPKTDYDAQAQIAQTAVFG